MTRGAARSRQRAFPPDRASKWSTCTATRAHRTWCQASSNADSTSATRRNGTDETLATRVEEELARLGLDYEIMWRVAGRPFLTGRQPHAGGRAAAIKEETGLEPELSTSGGTSDGRFIAPYGVEVVELGPLNATIHKVNEEVLVARSLRVSSGSTFGSPSSCWPGSYAGYANLARLSGPNSPTAIKAPSSTNQISTQAGMLRPRNAQLTVAHSPEPVNTILIGVIQRKRVENIVEPRAAGGNHDPRASAAE